MVWFVVHEVCILSDGLTDTTSATEVAVICGTTVNEDGTLSARLKARLNCGLRLYNNSLVKHIVVSGGLGKEGHYEGSKMAEYLIGQGVPAAHVSIDNAGNTTRLTAQNVAKLFPALESATVVSQYFHISRAKLAMQQAGLEHVEGASPRYFEWRDFYSSTREFFGWYKYWWEGS